MPVRTESITRRATQISRPSPAATPAGSPDDQVGQTEQYPSPDGIRLMHCIADQLIRDRRGKGRRE